ncbi:ABC transporter permease [Rhodococcus rhodnii]|uniref:ABC peptide transporter n=1 Tax=Rhodococcus rhodnii LMG 5362 TaxID=1273125 RepID=R7WK02_9NOCA|nr:ABC transporter permease [Rhodococcus rhodnii]EOM75656.1 ABC peptide transporter [Rhodococcus rhodnii LMG 5362]
MGAAVLVAWGAVTAAFLAQVAAPGDRATAIINLRTGQVQERTPEEIAPIAAEYGFDRPVVQQYLGYLGGLLRGDLGTSYQQHRPVWDIIGEQVTATLVLTVTALVAAWLIMLVWVVATAGRTRRVRGLGDGVDTVLASLPQYWIGVVLMLVFALGLGWLPVVGGGPVTGLILPALTLALPLAGFLGQATRTEFERTLEQPFVLSARVRGMGDTAIRVRHVLRHAALAPLTLTGWALGATISGAVIAESLFTRQGLGRTLVSAVEARDLPVVTGIVVLIALVYVVVNLVVDALYPLIDPRLAS